MRTVDQLAFSVRRIESVAIPMRDGSRLSARLWLPEDCASRPVPAILECIPYRKGDMTAIRDAGTHGYLAGHGYACVRLDARGTGDAEGIYGDQFSAQHAEDAEDAIAWIASQSWCCNAVAMFGLSWGGAIALQTAARNPPALKAIVCSAGIDDRYQLRMPGGCLATSTLSAVVAQLSYATRPPDPGTVGASWRSMWVDRLRSVQPVISDWLDHPTRDAFWLATSLAPDYARIKCPTLLSAGFADPAFASSMLRTLANLEAPCEGIFGPWAHRYPHLAIPGPAVGYLQETVRFLDRWLKGVPVPPAPRMRAFMPRGFPISPTPEDRPGRWVSEAEWPSLAITPLEYRLGRNILAADSQPEITLDVPSDLLISRNCGEFMPLFGSVRGAELAGDQQQEDRQSLVFDSAPLRRPMELLGAPRLELAVDAREPPGQLVMRLCEVAPDGRSRRLSWGARNLALGDDLSSPRDLMSAGRGEPLLIHLDAVADTIAAGHRLRLALSSSYWPLLWPRADAGSIGVRTGASRLVLPVRPARAGEEARLEQARSAPGLTWSALEPGRWHRADEQDPVTGRRLTTIVDDMGVGRIEELGVVVSETTTRRFAIAPEDPRRVSIETIITFGFGRGALSTSTKARGLVSGEIGGLHAEHSIEAKAGEEVVYSKSWGERLSHSSSK